MSMPNAEYEARVTAHTGTTTQCIRMTDRLKTEQRTGHERWNPSSSHKLLE